MRKERPKDISKGVSPIKNEQELPVLQSVKKDHYIMEQLENACKATPGDNKTLRFSLSGGKEKFYRNLYAGNLVFRKGFYRIKLPDSDVGWDNLQEKHFCPDHGGVDTYYDISNLQKK